MQDSANANADPCEDPDSAGECELNWYGLFKTQKTAVSKCLAPNGISYRSCCGDGSPSAPPHACERAGPHLAFQKSIVGATVVLTPEPPANEQPAPPRNGTSSRAGTCATQGHRVPNGEVRGLCYPQTGALFSKKQAYEAAIESCDFAIDFTLERDAQGELQSQDFGQLATAMYDWLSPACKVRSGSTHVQTPCVEAYRSRALRRLQCVTRLCCRARQDQNVSRLHQLGCAMRAEAFRRADCGAGAAD